MSNARWTTKTNTHTLTHSHNTHTLTHTTHTHTHSHNTHTLTHTTHTLTHTTHTHTHTTHTHSHNTHSLTQHTHTHTHSHNTHTHSHNTHSLTQHTLTHSQYVISLLFDCNQNVPQCYVIRTLPVCNSIRNVNCLLFAEYLKIFPLLEMLETVNPCSLTLTVFRSSAWAMT